jgi:hypothetical protein
MNTLRLALFGITWNSITSSVLYFSYQVHYALFGMYFCEQLLQKKGACGYAPKPNLSRICQCNWEKAVTVDGMRC